MNQKTPNCSPSSPPAVPQDAARVREGSPTLIDAKAAGALLSLPHTWLLAEARADRIPYVKLGRYTRFNAEELEHWWRGRARGPWRRTGSDPVTNGRKSA